MHSVNNQVHTHTSYVYCKVFVLEEFSLNSSPYMLFVNSFFWYVLAVEFIFDVVIKYA